MIKQPEKVTCLTIISILLISTFAFLLPVNASTVFSDDFSSGNFNAWTSTYANPTMSGGIATFTVTQHNGAGCYAEKDQLPMSNNDLFSVSSSVRFNTIPNNGQGNSAIFFNAIVDSSDPETASVYAFIDGSQHFGLWIGQWPNYVTAYDTATVQANTYYNVTIQLDNANQQAKLIIDGQTKVTHSYTAYSAFQNSNYVNIIEGIVANYAWVTVQVKLDYVVVNSEGGGIPTGTIANLSDGSWTTEAHYNDDPIYGNGSYYIPRTLGSLSASNIPNLDNCSLPAAIFRGYCRWICSNGDWDISETPILSFDIWVDKVMEIQAGLVDHTNGGWNPNNKIIADTYHGGQVNTPPYDYAYGTGVITTEEGKRVMTGPTDGSLQHYTVDLRELDLPLDHVSQVVINLTADHTFDMHWKIYNVTLQAAV